MSNSQDKIHDIRDIFSVKTIIYALAVPPNPSVAHTFTGKHMATQTILPPLINPLLRLPTVKQANGKSRTAIYRDIQKGLMTRPVKIGTLSAWPQNEVVALNKARIAGKSDEEIRKLVEELHAARRAA